MDADYRAQLAATLKESMPKMDAELAKTRAVREQITTALEAS